MEIVGLLLGLCLLNVDAHKPDYCTVVNIHNGENTAPITSRCEPSSQNCTDNLDSCTETLKDVLLKLDNLSEQMKSYNSKLSNIEKKVEHLVRPRDCDEIQSLGYRVSGEYTIFPNPGLKGFQVRCDMDTAPGGWTVIQRRVSDSDFYKTWKEYKYGFGDINENYWFGNEAIHMVSSQGKYKLRVDLTSMENEKAYAEYDFFSVGDAASNYLLKIGKYSGNAGDSLSSHNNKMFSTKDRNNDIDGKQDCPKLYIGAWWYARCHDSNLNGDYGNKQYAKGPVWQHWKGYTTPLKETEMKIRPQ